MRRNYSHLTRLELVLYVVVGGSMDSSESWNTMPIVVKFITIATPGRARGQILRAKRV